jgi:hypothetical protein
MWYKLHPYSRFLGKDLGLIWWERYGRIINQALKNALTFKFPFQSKASARICCLCFDVPCCTLSARSLSQPCYSTAQMNYITNVMSSILLNATILPLSISKEM